MIKKFFGVLLMLSPIIILFGLACLSMYIQPKQEEPPPPIRYVVTCYAGDKIIFERDGIFIGEVFDAGDRKYKLMMRNCVAEQVGND